MATFIGEKEKLQKRRVGDLWGLGAHSPQEPVIWSTGERWATPRAWRVESTWGQRDACRCGATKLSKFMSHSSYVLGRPEAKAYRIKGLEEWLSQEVGDRADQYQCLR